MKEIVTYLNFDGNCREAMTFYGQCLSLELQVMPFSREHCEVPPGAENRLMHSRLTKGSAPVLMASDTMPGMPFQIGNNFSVSAHFESVEEIDKAFAALGEGGAVVMPLQATFWAARFGMLKDRFGVHWMFSLDSK
ncbi:MAG: VOC family protein [Bryobacteraceae bacterium]